MRTERASSGRMSPVQARDSIPVLVVLLGPARDFLIAIAVLGFTLLVAMAAAYLAYG